MSKKKEALDLISEKPPRRVPAKDEPAAAPAPAAAATPEPPSTRKAMVGGQHVSEAKKNALNLFEEEEKRAERRKERPVLERDDASLFTTIGASKPAPPSPPPPVETVQEDTAVVEETEDGKKIIQLKPPIIVKELADALGLKPFKLMQDLMALDVFANQNQSIEPEIAAAVCEKHGFVFEREKREKGAGVHKKEEVIIEPEPEKEPEREKLMERPPIVTVMGHVDHGKTSLLDALRDSRVVAGEFGGITQHIAAYSVPHNGKLITFIDTPGHQAFTKMRARGANITDIVVLVVAADDGVKPTTKEAISHARAAGVEIIVAINKMDLPTARPDQVKKELQAEGLVAEDWGGQTICVEISAVKRQGLDTLLDMILLQSEMLELKADPDATARAYVVEARMESGKGPTASVIVQAGTLRTQMPFICGDYWGKIRSILDDRGNPIKEAGLSAPVEVLGFSGVPTVGDELVQMESERKSKKLSDERLENARLGKLERPVHATLESFFGEMKEGQKKLLKVVLKTDVAGSGEAIVGELERIKSDKISLEVIHTAAGPVTESDILLASASDAVIIGFNTRQESNAVKAARREGVQVKLFSIIYELVDQVKEAMLGMLDPETREKSLGLATVKKVFKLPVGRVAGCLVTKGRILRVGRARVTRDGQQVYDGAVQTLKRFYDDVDEVKNGLECGIRLGKFNDYEENDVIECYELEKIALTL